MIFGNNKLFDIRKLKNKYPYQIEYWEVCSSTMDLAYVDAKMGKIFIADYQYKGQARFENRSWESSYAENLMLTITTKKEDDDFYLVSLKIAVAIANMLRKEYLLEPSVKWPNDVLLNNKKVAGILCRVYGDILHIGIGLNVNQLNFNKSFNATSLALELGKKLEREIVFDLLISYISFYLRSTVWIKDLWTKEINSFLWQKGNVLNYDILGSKISGRVLRVREDGALLLETENNEIEAIFSGEAVLEKEKK